jgi:hypothetical protein
VIVEDASVTLTNFSFGEPADTITAVTFVQIGDESLPSGAIGGGIVTTAAALNPFVLEDVAPGSYNVEGTYDLFRIIDPTT